MPSATDLSRDEAYASAPVDEIVHHVVTLDHPAFDVPLHFITGVDADVGTLQDDGSITLRIVLETGTAVTAIATAFDMTPPGFDDSGPSAAKLSVDGVASKLFPVLQSAVGGGAISVTYRAYLGNDFATVVEVIEGLELRKVSLSATTAEGELTYPEIATQAFPRRTYDLDTYPGLWNS